jgi:hypothetical protein
MMQPARLTFACELQAEPLEALFADPTVQEDLAALGARVSLAILDLTARRAATVRRLNAAGIPVVAWQLLPKSQGYFATLDNAPQAAAAYAQFKAWTDENGLAWVGVGLDIEPDLRDLQRLAGPGRGRLLLGLPSRLLDGGQVRRARESYGALVARMRADGYRVESYQFPFIVDERKAGSTVLQRLFRVMDVAADQETLMLYSSFAQRLRPWLGSALLWSYGPYAQVIGVGITGQGVEADAGLRVPALSWDELSRDLRLARRWRDEILIYSLEGCVGRGLLQRLRTFDWNEPVGPPLDAARRVDQWREALRSLLWATSHPLFLLAAILAIAWLVVSLRGV